MIFGKRWQWRYWTLTTDPHTSPTDSSWMAMSHLPREQDNAQFIIVSFRFQELDDEVSGILSRSQLNCLTRFDQYPEWTIEGVKALSQQYTIADWAIDLLLFTQTVVKAT